MHKIRLDAFSYGILTINHHHHGAGAESAAQSEGLQALRPMHPVLLGDVLSFIYVGVALLMWLMPDRRIKRLIMAQP